MRTRTRLLVALTGATLAATLLAGAGNAGTTTTVSSLRVTVTDLDASGRPLGPPRPARPSERSLQASGCRDVDIYKEAKSFLFRSIVYRWHHTKRWCWSNGRITTVVTTAYATNVDPNWYYRGIAASASYFYNSNTAHYSFRQARMENCVLKIGCVGSEYPWVKIWTFGDGSYRWERGT
ncbi:MAG: hypothetical protein IT201_06280 [Thermoleophilia bacterium]|nr:hypothetical protein [Thermoleophilia bacterium]